MTSTIYSLDIKKALTILVSCYLLKCNIQTMEVKIEASRAYYHPDVHA
jgi:hypothetical protein